VPLTVKPTQMDIAIAHAVARHTNKQTEQAADVFTWAGDEHVLGALAVGWWL